MSSQTPCWAAYHGATARTSPAAFATPDTLRADLAFARDSFPDRGDAPLPIGLGFIGWLLDANEAQSKELIDIALESGVQALWLAFGVDLQRWVHYIRTSPAAARAPHKPLIFVQATSLAEALVAANEWKVGVIIAQGTPPSLNPISQSSPESSELGSPG